MQPESITSNDHDSEHYFSTFQTAPAQAMVAPSSLINPPMFHSIIVSTINEKETTSINSMCSAFKSP